MEVFFAQFVPEMLLWVEFGGIGWQGQKTQIARQTEVLAFVPAGAIEYHREGNRRQTKVFC